MTGLERDKPKREDMNSLNMIGGRNFGRNNSINAAQENESKRDSI